MNNESLTLTVHGESGVGKSWLTDTAPKPLLVLDAEGGSRFTRSRKTTWNPKDAPPENDGTWDTCVVTVKNIRALEQTYSWLNSGKHPFKSVALDSLSEIQSRCMDAIVDSPDTQVQRQHWGQLLRTMERLVRDFRDLTMHETNPVSVVVLVCLTFPRGEDQTVMRPQLSGQMQIKLPAYVDVVGYLYTDATPEGEFIRKLLVQPYNGFVAKDRTGRLPAVIDNPDIEKIHSMIYAREVVA